MTGSLRFSWRHCGPKQHCRHRRCSRRQSGLDHYDQRAVMPPSQRKRRATEGRRNDACADRRDPPRASTNASRSPRAASPPSVSPKPDYTIHPHSRAIQAGRRPSRARAVPDLSSPHRLAQRAFRKLHRHHHTNFKPSPTKAGRRAAMLRLPASTRDHLGDSHSTQSNSSKEATVSDGQAINRDIVTDEAIANATGVHVNQSAGGITRMSVSSDGRPRPCSPFRTASINMGELLRRRGPDGYCSPRRYTRHALHSPH